MIVLVLVALTLVTISFRSPTSGALHSVQGAGSTALRPFQTAATRIAQPFRDGYNYVDSLANARAENRRLKRVNAALRAGQLSAAARMAKFPAYDKLFRLEHNSNFPSGYNAINVGVTSFPAGPFTHTLEIGGGSSSGIHMNAPVVSGDGLVGIVSNVFSHSAVVTLITDPSSFVAARDLRTGVRGGVQAGPGGGGTLVLSEVPKDKVVRKGDALVTDGTHSKQFPSLYPYGIPIGKVAAPPGATDTAVYLQVQVQPFVNFGSLDAVAVLIPKKQHR